MSSLRASSGFWTLAFLIPAVVMAFWVFGKAAPHQIFSALYDGAMPFAFRWPTVILCVSAIAAWLLSNSRERTEFPGTQCVRSPRRILAIAFFALALVFGIAFGKNALWTIASILAGWLILQSAAGIGTIVLLLPPLNLHPGRFHGRATEHYVLAAALGLGLLSLLVFVLGTLGVLQREVWLTLIAISFVFTRKPREHLTERLESALLDFVRAAHPLALLAAFFTLAWFLIQSPLITAAPLEYDVLEYHLAAPLQYLRDGKITFLDNNVYACMASSAEMLFLLPLALFPEPHRGLYGAHFLLWASWALTALSVYAITARILSPVNSDTQSASGRADFYVAPTLAAVFFAIVPMGSHLAADFYVEHVQTLFHIAAALAVVAFFKERRTTLSNGTGWLLAAGFCAGFCCSTKYAGLLFTLGPLLALVPLLCAFSGSLMEGVRAAFVLGTPAALVLAPWLARNVAASGDPIFPLGLVMQRRASPVADIPSRVDHLEVAVRSGERSASAFVQALRSFFPPLSPVTEHGAPLGHWAREAESGPHLIAGLVSGIFSAVRIESVFIALLFAMDLIIWFLFSHRLQRFFFPALPLLAVLSGLGFARLWQIRAAQKLVGAALVLSVLLIAPLAMLFSATLTRPEALLGESSTREAMIDSYEQVGNRPWAQSWRALNELPASSRTLFIGDAQTTYVGRDATYNVVFNAGMLDGILATSESARDVAALLRAEGITHVYFNYSEWLRLDTSYSLKRRNGNGPWEFHRFEPRDRAEMWDALNQHHFEHYAQLWPPQVTPAYMKFTRKQFALLEEFVRKYTRSHRSFYSGDGDVACEIRTLAP